MRRQPDGPPAPIITRPMNHHHAPPAPKASRWRSSSGRRVESPSSTPACPLGADIAFYVFLEAGRPTRTHSRKFLRFGIGSGRVAGRCHVAANPTANEVTVNTDDNLLQFLARFEAGVEQRGWDAAPQEFVLRRNATGYSAHVSPVPQGTADLGGYLENRAAAFLNPMTRARLVTRLGPDVHGLGVVTEAWGLFDAMSTAQALASSRPRPVSHHPQRQELRFVWAVVPGRDLCLHRIRGNQPAVLHDSACSPIGMRVEGRIPEALRTMLATIPTVR